MSKVCILTDSTAQFTQPAYPGCEHVCLIPMHVEMGDQFYPDSKDLRAAHLPTTGRLRAGAKLIAPSPEEFRQLFVQLGRKYNEIVVLVLSSHLSPAFSFAVEASMSSRSSAKVHVIDSQTTAVGLGLLVQAAAEASKKGASTVEISRLVRGMIPHIYTVFCLQSLTYLYHSGHIDPAQAVVGEMLGIMPFFILENGRLVPVQKIRNSRHLVDVMIEFINEFINLKHIALVQGIPPFDQEMRNLRERVNSEFPGVSLSEHLLGAGLASLLGPRCISVVAMEDTYDL